MFDWSTGSTVFGRYDFIPQSGPYTYTGKSALAVLSGLNGATLPQYKLGMFITKPEGGCLMPLNVSLFSTPSNITLNGLKVYPNPSEGIFNLQGELAAESDVRVDVLSLLGQVVYTEELGASSVISKELNLRSLGSGSYILRVTVGNRSEVKNIVITK